MSSAIRLEIRFSSDPERAERGMERPDGRPLSEMRAIATSRLAVVAAGFAALGCSGEAEHADVRNAAEGVVGEEIAEPTPPPHVPPPIGRAHASRVVLNLEIVEQVTRIAGGEHYTVWTFDGIAPGSSIRVRVGDVLAFVVRNHPDNRMPHAIEVRAVTGEGGRAASGFIAPGQSSRFQMEVATPGLLVYQAAATFVGLRVANRMSGLILAEPRGGLRGADRASEHSDIGGLLQHMLRTQGFAARREDDRIFTPKGGVRRAVESSAPPMRTPTERIAVGEAIYERTCAVCHRANGRGVPGLTPPLAGSDYLMADRRRAIEAVIRGLHGEIEVNGDRYDGVMPAMALDDEEVANVMTFVFHRWGDSGEIVTPARVKAVRDAAVQR